MSEANLDKMQSIKSGALKSQANAKPLSIGKVSASVAMSPNNNKSTHYKSKPSISNDFFVNENVDQLRARVAAVSQVSLNGSKQPSIHSRKSKSRSQLGGHRARIPQSAGMLDFHQVP